MRPHVALITTIAPAHLEFFGTCEAIADAKSEIFEGLVPGGAALIPADSPYAERLTARARQAQCRAHPVASAQSGERRALISFARPDGEGMRVKADILGRAVDCPVGAPGAHIAQQCGGALAAVALLDGDVLNAAAALKNFTALKGRGARFDAGGDRRDRRKLQRQSGLHGGGAGAAGAAQPKAAARSRCWATCWKWARAAPLIMPALAAPIEAAQVDLVFASGPQMKALWDALPASRRGAYAETSAELAPQLLAALEARRHGAGQGLARQPACR